MLIELYGHLYCSSLFRPFRRSPSVHHFALPTLSRCAVFEETARKRMERDQDSVVKSLRCSAAKHPVRNEQYVAGHCHGAIGSHFGAMDVSF
ncbi:hypothetical protein TNCV_1386671 [Trichonephila clavipes]|nr:hypothetical protein TNCV_1386671 [Trichonephila clavipes]